MSNKPITFNISEIIPKEIILYGGTGQSMQVRPIIEDYGSTVIAIIDDTPGLKSPFDDIPIFAGYEKFIDFYNPKMKSETGFCITIGNPHADIRIKLHKKLTKDGFLPVSIKHRTAWINDDVTIGIGAQILEDALVSARVTLGMQCIINSKASVGHESRLSDGVEIGPNATVTGLVEIGYNTWVGAGAVILPRLKIGKQCIIGAGSVVMKDVPCGTTVFGNPARPLLQKK